MKRLETIERSKLAVAGLALGVVLFFAVNIFSNAAFQSARLDMTEDRLFTLADGTRRILDRIEEPITLGLYISQRLVKKDLRESAVDLSPQQSWGPRALCNALSVTLPYKQCFIFYKQCFIF